MARCERGSWENKTLGQAFEQGAWTEKQEKHLDGRTLDSTVICKAALILPLPQGI